MPYAETGLSIPNGLPEPSTRPGTPPQHLRHEELSPRGMCLENPRETKPCHNLNKKPAHHQRPPLKKKKRKKKPPPPRWERPSLKSTSPSKSAGGKWK